MAESSLLISRLDSEHKLIAVLANMLPKHLYPHGISQYSSNESGTLFSFSEHVRNWLVV